MQSLGFFLHLHPFTPFSPFTAHRQPFSCASPSTHGVHLSPNFPLLPFPIIISLFFYFITSLPLKSARQNLPHLIILPNFHPLPPPLPAQQQAPLPPSCSPYSIHLTLNISALSPSLQSARQNRPVAILTAIKPTIHHRPQACASGSSRSN